MNMKRHLKQQETKTPDEFPHDLEREARIAEVAYLKAEQRGFVPGHELEDWLMAEREIMLEECSGCYSRQSDEAPPKAA